MADPIVELNSVTQQHFMPVVTNQIWQKSPILDRIFKPSREGDFGLALPSFDGRSIVEPLELGRVAQESTAYSTGTVTVTNDSTAVVGAGTTWTAAMANRSYITSTDGKDYAIASVTDGTHLVLKSVYEGGTLATQSYVLTYWKTTTNSVGSYAKTTTWAPGTGDVLGGGEFDWKMYHVTLKIHNFDIQINQGKARLFDIVALKMRNATKELRQTLITDFYSTQADGGNAMIGLQAMIARTGLVGGIQKRKYGWWQGHVDAASSDRDLSWALLNTAWYATKKFGYADPATLIVASDGVLQKYEDNLSKVVVTGSSATRYENIQLQMGMDKARKVIEGGWDAFMFKHIPMISDPLMPVANKLFLINENYIHWRVLKNFESTGWQQLKAQGKDWVQLTINGYGALTTSNCSKHGMISDLNEA